MKKIFIILLILSSLLVMPSCQSQSDDSYSSSSNSSSDSSLSESEKESIAEQKALSSVFSHLKDGENAKFRDYNINETRYKVGSITKSLSRYTVKGTLYLYDKYGSLKDTATFSCDVDFSGGSSRAYLPSIDIQ